MADPASRGRLVIADRVVDRVATIAATEVDGVVRPDTGALDRLVGRAYPRSSSTVAAGRARVDVQVAVAWPEPLATVTAAVRDRVRDRVASLTGLAVDAVDVTAADVVRTAPAPARRRVR